MLFKKHYIELDLARAAAITLVMLFHLNEKVFHLPGDALLTRFFAWGFHGVDLFFVLSGFLIGGQLIEENLAGSFSFRRFYLKRFWRIFPPYYFAILVFIAFYSIGTRRFILKDALLLKDVVVHVLYLQDYIRPIMHGGLYWSLAVEEQFYILIPLILFLLIKYSRNRLFAALVLLVLTGVSARFFLYDNSKDWWMSFYAPFHTRFDSLIFGVLTAFIFISRRDIIKGSLPWKAALLSITALSLGICFIYGGFSAGYFNTCWQFIFTGVGFSTLILFLTSFSFGRFIPFQKAVGSVAKFSYTMYLYHTLIMILVVNLLTGRFEIDGTSFLNFLIIFAVYFAAVFLLSALIYWLVDRPCMNYRRRLSGTSGVTSPARGAFPPADPA